MFVNLVGNLNTAPMGGFAPKVTFAPKVGKLLLKNVSNNLVYSSISILKNILILICSSFFSRIMSIKVIFLDLAN